MAPRGQSLASIIKRARHAVKGLSAAQPIKRTAAIALKSLRGLKRRAGSRRGIRKERVLPMPGGSLSLLPIFAGLSAIGSLAGGASGIAKAIATTTSAKKRLDELKKRNEPMTAVALGRGLYLRPYRKGLGLYMTPYVKSTKKN